jgi:mono/diheme cytochrome c family protein
MVKTVQPVILATAFVLIGTGASHSLHAQRPQVAAASSSSATQYRAVLDRYCVTCHNEKLKTGGLMLDRPDLANLGGDAKIWETVALKLRSETMPPPGLPRPDAATYGAFVAWLETGLDRAEAAKPNPGRPPALHRLNRAEYANAVRDVLDVQIDAASLLPPDDASFGFDNVADGAVSPTLLERYVTAARKISRLAVGSSHTPLEVQSYRLPIDFTQNDQIDGLPFGTRGGMHVRYQFPVDGEYEVWIYLTHAPSPGVAPHQVEVAIDRARVQLLKLEAKSSSDLPRQLGGRDNDDGLHVRTLVKAGLRDVAVTFLKRPSVEFEGVRESFLSDQAGILPPLEGFDIRGPYNAAGAGDTPSRRRIFVCRPASAADEPRCARQILSTAARRAYRRPVADADVQDLVTFYESGRANGGSFDAGIEMALRRMLVSPSFLFRVERDPVGLAAGSSYRIGDLELASRLSFFLWSSVPDEVLLNLAARRKLSDPVVLEQQVKRMLADPRSQALVVNFAGQWLYLRNLPNAQPDHPQFPDFDENLRRSMRRETELFFESVLKENGSVMDLLTANYTFVDERLARHYGIPNVYGSQFRRVTFGSDSVRGGLLGQGSILTVTSHTNRTSPVTRGKWVLENILGAPPPPPPPNVPDLKDKNPSGQVLSMRERMVQHRANPVCASCHARMDPIGLSLENFDAVGRWRTRGESNEPIDASGSLPDGVPFQGAAGLRQALLRHSDDFVRTLTQKLLIYAVGRGLEYYDQPAVRAIASDTAKRGNVLGSLIVAIVKSEPFQMRRTADAPSSGTVASLR